MKRLRILWLVFLTILNSGSGLLAQTPGGVVLTGHVLKQLQTSTKLDQVPANQSIPLSLVVNVDQNLLNKTLQEIYSTPLASRHYLSSAEFARKFDLANKRQMIKNFAAANGLTVDPTRDNPLSMLVKVSGTAQQVQNAFSVSLYHYRGADGKIFMGHETEPTIPASLAPHLSAVIGLSVIPGILKPMLQVTSKTRTPRSSGLSGTGPLGFLAPADIKSVYGLGGVALIGTGQKLALVEFDGYNPSDITAYDAQFGLPNTPLTNVFVSGATNVCNTVNGCAEVTLDIELMAALAPNISQILVYEAPNSINEFTNVYDQIGTDNIASAVSASWDIDEGSNTPANIAAENTAFVRMAAQGQSNYIASGDTGSHANGVSTSVNDPASQPLGTSVGGTSLSGTISPLSIVETVWNSRGYSGASGGGVSGTNAGSFGGWPIPAYQVGVSGTASTTFRNVPDVALNADPDNSPYAIYQLSNFGGWTGFGGTSCAAPLWAAFTALINQQQVASGAANLGNANATIYPLATGPSYNSLFNDITVGTNGDFNAGPGYDNTTGWGSFKGAAILAAVMVVLPPVPPTITSQPASITVGVGTPGSFSVGATGPSLTYQWQKGVLGVFTNILGATGSSYTTPPTTFADSLTQYQCQVTNTAGSVLSTAATLTVVADINLSNLLVFPNPWDVRKHNGFPMRFSGLPDGATVKIFTISAHSVKTLTASGGTANWDLTNDSGQSVASGYYIYLITDSQGDKATGKLAVIR